MNDGRRYNKISHRGRTYNLALHKIVGHKLVAKSDTEILNEIESFIRFTDYLIYHEERMDMMKIVPGEASVQYETVD